ncbi:MAG: hypothetical protein A3H57_01985 [Candidatus Taylorbacteria bacterium RIFCSPLOWO2_02_FULL_43_11]|uniref:Uncharacterized protein n=1 Tax=Candidatus Taylorbacteria bacterium RIFCSPHIGHO2_02_FULL_43_32b TaxID=1802306 RepID=A0A1G2MHF3_9BACT|nr:MAG: hypothetical protein A3C72_00670 [Candidatus Taylorbacteria bacterium RIFCSPHIGHO2_02_FULL_43_32b]OHA29515.1 MAG: hypothetical protein A3B08_01725 [Candidatus Taylorbacteria bacterium RIFCSPLOWO2_01_FULL_43_44]OHA37447.1 MAG: hypothetical protein A3H57_01985 [Candidatus Taylorbacteria bacterium RIFCSPLOWO2_02_FULL_43_11]
MSIAIIDIVFVAGIGFIVTAAVLFFTMLDLVLSDNWPRFSDVARGQRWVNKRALTSFSFFLIGVLLVILGF